MGSNNKAIPVRSSYFKMVNKRVCTNQEQLGDDNYDIGTYKLSGDQLKKSGMLKRRKLSGIQNFEDVTLQPISSDNSPPVVDGETSAGCDTDEIEDQNIRTEGGFGCNVSHVDTYSGIAEKSMDKFAALVSSFRYPGSRASGLRAPLKDVKNTLSVRSVLRAPEQGKFRCTAKKTDRGPTLRSIYTSDDNKIADSPPDISTFAYGPMKTVASDQGKTTDPADRPPNLGTFAYTPMESTICLLDRSKCTGTAIRIADRPDLSTFAYKPMKDSDKRSDGSKFRGTTLKAAGGTFRSRFK